ncbi:putative glutamine amidotransferase of anthranilate synthase [Candidatus Tremblaya princeps PCIT]|uniref:Putative glutamine amidotransferase of anthranilate synthase n=1 Tax=Tremblaya princeps (strain PCIT) TaxID=891398 RepID=F7XYG4_TREPP|nr:putative glutamine amidotransferase of anthranilate synthase [Candidatus Tremblaya princeps PCIT]
MIRSTSELDREDGAPMSGCRCTHTRTLYGRAMARSAPASPDDIGLQCAAVGPLLRKHGSARSHAPVLVRFCSGTRLRTPKLCTSSSSGDTGRAVCRLAGRLGIRTRAATHPHRAAAGALGILGHDAMWDDGAGLLYGVPQGFMAARYNSLTLRRYPAHGIRCAAWRAGCEVMAVRHASLPTQCVQFHPESEFSPYRRAIFANMVSLALVST